MSKKGWESGEDSDTLWTIIEETFGTRDTRKLIEIFRALRDKRAMSAIAEMMDADPNPNAPVLQKRGTDGVWRAV